MTTMMPNNLEVNGNNNHSSWADPYLLPHLHTLDKRLKYINDREERITCGGSVSLYDFSDYHEFFGLHKSGNGWIFREWAPNAVRMYIVGDRTGWKADNKYTLRRVNTEGIWEGRFSEDSFRHGDLFRLKVAWPGGEGDRIPSGARRVIQDPDSLIFNAQVWQPENKYLWRHSRVPGSPSPLLIYEAHIGMAQEKPGVGTCKEFMDVVIPKIAEAGYNTIQLMAVQEHPYYGSFGYHVSNFFAFSSRFGTPDDFKSLVDSAHGLGLRVVMDIVHSHAAKNEVEGLSRFDGSLDQFFYPGDRGLHRLWDSRCFDYSKDMVVRFLLSNCRYWMEEFMVDGFRFDGITSMLFKDHGISRAFINYDDYFKENDVDLDALSYLHLANSLVHNISSSAITIAEDVSGYPGLAAASVNPDIPDKKSPQVSGLKYSIGFDYRFAMGIPDFWIRLLKEKKDEDWHLGTLWHELNSRRYDEKSISYAESHDQALVGDQTIMMRLMGDRIFSSMETDNESIETVRGVALHKMIRLITIATAGHGYLNFMGNEFGHPEWIDFPSERNGWSYFYARRQWSLKDDENCFFSRLAIFDRDMITLVKDQNLFLSGRPDLLFIHEDDKIIAFKRGNLIFIFNFHGENSFFSYPVDAPPGKYREILSSDSPLYGGRDRMASGQIHFTLHDPGMYGDRNILRLYLPTRTAIVLLWKK